MFKRLLIFGSLAAIVVIAAAVGGWWYFIREDAELATNAREIPNELVQPTSTQSADGTGDSDTLTFVIIPEESEAAYFVDEELASVGLPSTAKGETNDIEGQFTLNPDGTLAGESLFTVDLTTLVSDEDRRDNRVQQALETGTFPTATFTATSVSGYDLAIAEGEEHTMTLTGTLDLHGVQREVTWDMKARVQGNVITGLATLVVPFAVFNITPPTFAGLVSIDGQATLQVQIVAQDV